MVLFSHRPSWSRLFTLDGHGWDWRQGALVTLKDMFADDDDRTFEERRDEVLSIVIQALDLKGQDHFLRRDVQRCRRASSEREFDEAYESLVTAISKTPLHA